MSAARPLVAILGLGLMGGGMARRLLAEGFPVTIWNRSAERTRAAGLEGARVAQSPADAVGGAAVVIAMVANDEASRSVWEGPDGALAAMERGAIAIESSTLTVDRASALGRDMAARGVDFLDAPVTGSRDQASSGALKFLVGGDAGVLARARPVLDALGTDAVHLGPVGSGTLLKLVNNFLCGVQVASLAESIAMIERSGLDPARSLAVLMGGALASPLIQTVAPRMMEQDYEPRFLASLMAKDLAYAADAFATMGIALGSARAAEGRFRAVEGGDFAMGDIASIVEPIRAAPRDGAA